MQDEITVKGSPIKSLLKFLQKELTPEQLAEVYSIAPESAREQLRSGVFLASQTLPVTLVNQMIERAAAAKGESVETFAKRVGKAGASDAVAGIYRLLVLVLTPPAILKKAGLMWSGLYNRGKLEIMDQTSDTATIRLSDFPSQVAGCSRITGWIERMAELTGATVVSLDQHQCFAKGAPHCEWKLRWK